RRSSRVLHLPLELARVLINCDSPVITGPCPLCCESDGGRSGAIRRCVPQPTHAPRQRNVVGARLQGHGHGQAERLGDLQVDDQLELGWLHDWHLRRTRALEDLTDIVAGLSIHPADARAIAQEPTNHCELAYESLCQLANATISSRRSSGIGSVAVM